MNNEFSQEDYKNILALINRVDIKGGEALAVAVLQQKINGLLTPEPVKEEK